MNHRGIGRNLYKNANNHTFVCSVKNMKYASDAEAHKEQELCE